MYSVSERDVVGCQTSGFFRSGTDLDIGALELAFECLGETIQASFESLLLRMKTDS